MNVNEFLNNLEQEYQAAQEISLDALPDGEYVCEVDEAEIRPNKNAEGVHLYLKLRVIDGQFTRRIIFHRRAITSTTLNFVKTDAKVLGVDGTLGTMSSLLPRTVGKEIAVVLKTTTSRSGQTQQNSYLHNTDTVKKKYAERLLKVANEKGIDAKAIIDSKYHRPPSLLKISEFNDLIEEIQNGVPTPISNSDLDDLF